MRILIVGLSLFLFSCVSMSNEDSRASNGPAFNELSDSSLTDTQKSQFAKNEMTAIDTIGNLPTIEFLTGRFEPKNHPNFEKIPASLANREGLYLQTEALAAFKKMHAQASKDGVKLTIISATRNFKAQKAIWEGKWSGARKLSGGIDASKMFANPKDRALEILKWSSMPGTSRHHWGTDIDLNALTNSFFESGEGEKIYLWLTKNAHEYGFCQPYSPKGANRPNGYNEEKWHWSYKPAALPLTQMAREQLSNTDITGFLGAEVAADIDVVNNFILGIDPSCQ